MRPAPAFCRIWARGWSAAPGRRSRSCLWTLWLLAAWVGLRGAAADPNRMLDLDGSGGFIELPPGVFADLSAATVECRVLWRSMQIPMKRVFNYGAALRDFSLGARSDGVAWAVIVDPTGHLHDVRAPLVLETNQWYHLAATMGPEGLQLFVNGWLMGTNATRLSFDSLGTQGRHRIGGTVSERDSPTRFDGWIDEVRVWNRQLSSNAIVAHARGDYASAETGLVAHWSFDDGTARDLGPRKLLSTATGAVRYAEGSSQPPADWLPPGRLHVEVLGADGKLLRPIFVGVYREDRTVLETIPIDTDEVSVPRSTAGMAHRVELLHPEFGTNLTGVRLDPGTVQRLVVRTKTAAGDNPDLKPDSLPARRFAAAVRRILERDASVIDRLDARVLVALAPQLKNAVPILTNLVAVGNTDARRYGLFLLGQFKPPTAETIRVLQRAVGHADPVTRGLAIAALANLPVPPDLAELYDKKFRTMSALFAGLLLPFALIHGWLFLLHRENRSHLDYALFVLSAAALTWILGTRTGGVGAFLVVSVLFLGLGLRFLYSLFYPRLPAMFWILAIPGVVSILLILPSFDSLGEYFAIGLPTGSGMRLDSWAWLGLLGASLFTLAATGEMARVLLIAMFRRKRGAFVMGLGFVALMGGAILLPALWIGLFTGAVPAERFIAWNRFLPHAGIAGFAVCASIHLARSLAQSHRDLQAAHREVAERNAELLTARSQAEQAREAAEKANRWKSSFLANMSHELRTPLNAIIGYSEMLTEEAPEIGADSLVPDLRKIHSAAHHQLSLVNDILDLSKIEAGRMSVALADFDLSSLVREVEATVQPLIGRKSNRLEVEAPTESIPMHSDATKLRQVLLNLLSNAAKFTERGTIRLQVTRAPDRTWVQLAVQDTGIGMTPEQVGRLFQAFVQAETTTQSRYGGTGLGLAISRSYCEMLGGRLEVVSELGRGSTFTVALPLRSTANPVPASAKTSNPAPPAL